MKREPKVSVVKSRALTDPKPSFVSMVTKGAIQRPFRAVKADVAGEVSAAPETTEKEQTMTFKTSNGHDIAALYFATSAFPSEISVKAWLDEGGYQDVEIVAEAERFIVVNKAVTFEEGSITEVAGVVEGMTALVGKIAGEEVAEKTAEQVTAERAEANASTVQPVAETTAKSDDPAPATAAVSVSKADTDVYVASTKAAGFWSVSEFASALGTLAWFAEEGKEWMGLSAEDITKLRGASAPLLEVLTNLSNNAIADIAACFAEAGVMLSTEKTEAPAPATATAEADATSDTPAATETAVVVTQKAEEAAPAAAPSEIDVLRAQIADLTALVASVVSAKSDEAAAKDDEADRARKADVAVQTRKGSDAVDAPKEAQKTKAFGTTKSEADMAAERFARSLGVTFQPRNLPS